MKIEVEHNGLQLIKRYDRYYIRFPNTQEKNIPCELKIKKEDAMEIFGEHGKISEIKNFYEEEYGWTFKELQKNAIEDYLSYSCEMKEERKKIQMDKFSRNKDIQEEFYQFIMFEKFPEENPIEILGYSAQSLYKATYLTIIGVYNYLIYLRESPKEALENLKNGLPKK